MVLRPIDAAPPHTEATDTACVSVWVTGAAADRLRAAADAASLAGAVDGGEAWLLDPPVIPGAPTGPAAPVRGRALPGRLWHLPPALRAHPALERRAGSPWAATPTAFAADPLGRVHRVEVLGPSDPTDTASAPRDVGPWTLFVYGTLRQGECRAAALQDPAPRHIVAASVPGRLWETPDDYPVWTPPPFATAAAAGSSDAPRVQGELVTWAAPPPWARLDEVEEFLGFGHARNLFLRTLVRATDGHGRAQLAWAYAAGPLVQPVRPIPSGDWCRREARPAPPATLSPDPEQGLTSC